MGSKLTTRQNKRKSGQLSNSLATQKNWSDSGQLSNLATRLNSFTTEKSSTAQSPRRRTQKYISQPYFYDIQMCNNLATQRKQKMIDSGQLSNNLATEQEKCYDPADTTLTFVDGDDDMDFLCIGYKSLRAKMSCGHTVTPMSLTDWCRRLLDKGECRFVCGQPGCDVEWPFEEVCKMALLTPKEVKYFEKQLFSRAARDYLDSKLCPGCRSYVVRTDQNNLRVCCTVCKAAKNEAFSFCWQCLKEWKHPSPYSDRCANAGCVNQSQEILRTCPDITFKDVKGVTGCPSIRACPTCGLLLEHDKTKCKNITCPGCKVGFCFVCLKTTKECLNSSSYYIGCFSGVAPRQTSIPVWKRKQAACATSVDLTQ